MTRDIPQPVQEILKYHVPPENIVGCLLLIAVKIKIPAFVCRVPGLMFCRYGFNLGLIC